MDISGKILVLVCCITAVKMQDIDTRWGIINGRLVDTFDDNLDQTVGGSFVGGVGVGAGVGIVGGAGINLNPGRPGDIRNLYPCRQLVCSRRQIFPPRCEYTPVLRSSLTGGNCLGCPEDICQQVSNIDLSGGNLGVNVREGGRNRQRGARRQQRRMRRIQRQACRRLGICDFQGQGLPTNTRVVMGNAGGLGGRRGRVFGNGGTGIVQGRRSGAVGNGGLDVFDVTRVGVVGSGIVGNGGTRNVGYVGRVDVNRDRSNIISLLGDSVRIN